MLPQLTTLGLGLIIVAALASWWPEDDEEEDKGNEPRERFAPPVLYATPRGIFNAAGLRVSP